jgi:hypothetical protein
MTTPAAPEPAGRPSLKGDHTMERLWSIAVDAPWRAYPAAALALLGLALVVRGLWFGAAGRPGLVRQGRDAYAWIRCFQVAVGGLALLGLAAAWVWQLSWLFVLALGVLGEELFETSRILTAINQNSGRPGVPERGRGATP